MFGFLSASPTVFPEADTVKEPQDTISVAEKAFKGLLEIDGAPDWVPLAYQDVDPYEGIDDIRLFDRSSSAEHPLAIINPVQAGTVSFAKATATLPVAPKVIFEKMWASDFAWLKTFDEDVTEFAKLLDVNPDVMVIRFRASAPFPISAREFVLARGRKEVDGVFYIFSRSVNYEHSPVDSTYVRAVIPANGFIFKPVEGDPNRTHVTRITAIDPKGAIPIMVINAFKTKGGDYMKRLKKAAAN